MKKVIILLFIQFFTISAIAQNTEIEDQVLGVWKLNITSLNEETKEEMEEKSELEKRIAKKVLEFVEEVLEEIDIRFHFKKNNVLLLDVQSDKEENDKHEELKWHTDSKGRILLDDIENENIHIDNDGYWTLKNGRLVHYDDDGSLNENLYMERIRD